MKSRWVSIPAALLIAVAGLAQAGGAAQNAQAPPAEVLAKNSGCFECHAVERKVVGPAYRDIADRYRDDARAREILFDKVRNGGKGNWTKLTRGVPMPAHGGRLTDDEIGRLVGWVLSL